MEDHLKLHQKYQSIISELRIKLETQDKKYKETILKHDAVILGLQIQMSEIVDENHQIKIELENMEKANDKLGEKLKQCREFSKNAIKYIKKLKKIVQKFKERCDALKKELKQQKESNKKSQTEYSTDQSWNDFDTMGNENNDQQTQNQKSQEYQQERSQEKQTQNTKKSQEKQEPNSEHKQQEKPQGEKPQGNENSSNKEKPQGDQQKGNPEQSQNTEKIQETKPQEPNSEHKQQEKPQGEKQQGDQQKGNPEQSQNTEKIQETKPQEPNSEHKQQEKPQLRQQDIQNQYINERINVMLQNHNPFMHPNDMLSNIKNEMYPLSNLINQMFQEQIQTKLNTMQTLQKFQTLQEMQNFNQIDNPINQLMKTFTMNDFFFEEKKGNYEPIKVIPECCMLQNSDHRNEIHEGSEHCNSKIFDGGNKIPEYHTNQIDLSSKFSSGEWLSKEEAKKIMQDPSIITINK